MNVYTNGMEWNGMEWNGIPFKINIKLLFNNHITFRKSPKQCQRIIHRRSVRDFNFIIENISILLKALNPHCCIISRTIFRFIHGFLI